MINYGKVVYFNRNKTIRSSTIKWSESLHCSNIIIYKLTRGIPDSTSDDTTICTNHDEISCCRFGYRSSSCPNYQAWTEKRGEASPTESESSRVQKDRSLSSIC